MEQKKRLSKKRKTFDIVGLLALAGVLVALYYLGPIIDLLMVITIIGSPVLGFIVKITKLKNLTKFEYFMIGFGIFMTVAMWGTLIFTFLIQ